MARTYLFPGARRLAAAAKLAGFTDMELPIILAIGGHESSGDAWIIGKPNPDGTRDYGIWQINEGAHKRDHPTWFKASGPQWSNYIDNAKMARAVYVEAGSKYTPWVSYTTGRYKGVRSTETGETWTTWASKGIVQMRSQLAAGTPLETIASIYLEPR